MAYAVFQVVGGEFWQALTVIPPDNEERNSVNDFNWHQRPITRLGVSQASWVSESGRSELAILFFSDEHPAQNHYFHSVILPIQLFLLCKTTKLLERIFPWHFLQ